MEWGPRSSGVSFFCFHALGDTKQNQLTPLDRGPPLHVNRVLVTRELKQQRRRRQRDRQKSNMFRLAKQQLCTCNTLVCTFHCRRSTTTTDVKVPYFTFCRGREHRTTSFFFYSRTLVQSFRIQL